MVGKPRVRKGDFRQSGRAVWLRVRGAAEGRVVAAYCRRGPDADLSSARDVTGVEGLSDVAPTATDFSFGSISIISHCMFWMCLFDLGYNILESMIGTSYTKTNRINHLDSSIQLDYFLFATLWTWLLGWLVAISDGLKIIPYMLA